jgi:hypothetical protein
MDEDGARNKENRVKKKGRKGRWEEERTRNKKYTTKYELWNEEAWCIYKYDTNKRCLFPCLLVEPSLPLLRSASSKCMLTGTAIC